MATVDESSPLHDRRGQPLRLLGGTLQKHKGYTGAWYDIAKPPTKCYYNIIVEKGGRLVSCRAKKENCGVPRGEPQTYVEACFQQVPMLEERLDSLTKLLAQCRITSSEEITDLFTMSLNRANTLQLNRGSAASYRLIDESALPTVVDDDYDDQYGDNSS